MSSATTPAGLLTARGLGRRYRGVCALRGVDLDVGRGEALALVGPNGAGKTTLLSILAGVERSDEGTLAWAGGVTPRIGWVPQRPAVYQRLSARENLRLFAALERREDPDAAAQDLLARADLLEVADRPAAQLSTGTLQRLNLAVTLAGRPGVLLLDEPTATLSPDQRHRLWAWLDELRGQDGVALLFSTQSVDEAQRHADRVAVLSAGLLLFTGTVPEMVERHGAGAGSGEAEAAELAFIRLVDPPA